VVITLLTGGLFDGCVIPVYGGRPVNGSIGSDPGCYWQAFCHRLHPGISVYVFRPLNTLPVGVSLLLPSCRLFACAEAAWQYKPAIS